MIVWVEWVLPARSGRSRDSLSTGPGGATYFFGGQLPLGAQRVRFAVAPVSRDAKGDWDLVTNFAHGKQPRVGRSALS